MINKNIQLLLSIEEKTKIILDKIQALKEENLQLAKKIHSLEEEKENLKITLKEKEKKETDQQIKINENNENNEISNMLIEEILLRLNQNSTLLPSIIKEESPYQKELHETIQKEGSL